MTNLLYPFLALAASVGLFFSPAPKIINNGDSFKLTINASSDGQMTFGTDVVLIYNPKFLTAIKINPGHIYPNYPENLQDIDDVMGKVKFSGTIGLNQTPKAADGVLGEVYFRAKQTGTTQVNFEWYPGGTNDCNIVPSAAGLDLLIKQPEGVNLTIKEPTSSEKVWILAKRILSFDYLRF